MMLRRQCGCVPLVLVGLMAAGSTMDRSAQAVDVAGSDQRKSAGRSVSFHEDVKPIFSRHCYGCHQDAKRLGSYSMTDFASLIAGGETGAAAIVPGDPDTSYLIDQITVVDGHAEMPDEPFAPLSQVEIETVARWVAEGAKDDSPTDPAPTFDADHRPTYLAAPSLPSIDVSPDGSLIALAGYHEVVLIDAVDGRSVARLVGMSPRINSVRFSPDGERLAAAGGTPAVRGELQVWDVQQRTLILSVPTTFDALSGSSWSPDGSMIAFGASDNTLRAVDASTGKQILFQGAHEDWVRDTAFTPDGKHLVSVARDMSCKLTEVETERFVDNITSITPGALSGGLSSVASHPTRNEVLIGGADGIAKVYRVFRETARKIGDDANLVRALPKLPGRIFSVAISPDGSRLAAAATLDGRSEVRVWQYDFDGTVDGELKKILAKRVRDRSASENEKVAQSRSQEITELAKFALDSAAIYAIDFAPNQSLLVAGNDGNVRRIGVQGDVEATFAAVDISPPDLKLQDGFDAKAYTEMLTQRLEHATDERVPDPESVVSISVSPERMDFDSPYDYAQLVITSIDQAGRSADITRSCEIVIPDWITMTSSGLARPTGDGQGFLTVRYGDNESAIKISARGVVGDDRRHGSVDYIRDVTPVLSRLGCNQGTCHGAQKGKNGFRLSLRGYDPIFDLRALTDDLSARRINPAAPEDSLMLRKPLGLTPHQGGTLMSAGDPNHTILRRWIADGSELDLDSARVTHIEVFPINPIVQATDSRQQVRVVAHYANGSNRDVTQEAFIDSGDSEVATSEKGGLLTAVRRGEAPILARFEGAYAATTLTVMGNRDGYSKPTSEAWSAIDELVAEKWDRVKVLPSDLCDDATFLRRVHLDLTGLPPTSDQVREFLADESPVRIKRSRVVDDLIGSEAYVEYWTNKWADLLQVNRKFLGVEGSTQFRAWIRNQISDNRPYDEFAAEILTASGSNNDHPPASYFKVLRTPEDTMENTTHLFLGIRFNCNKCHDHPFERWTQDQYFQMSAFFAQVALEPDPASGKRKIGGTAVEGAKPLFEKVVDKKTGDVMHPRTNKAVEPVFPFDVPHDAPESGATRRERLSRWLTDPDNPYFARSYVNRLWGYLLGAGLIEPIDDIRAGNPPTNPELLDHLTDTFVASDFNVAHMLRTICNSRTYQLSVQSSPMNADDLRNYSHALPRRLPAEVIYDAVHSVTGSAPVIPGVPAGTRAAELSDSGVKLADGFLQNLGRPARESACECERSSDLQLGPVMALISGPTIGTAIADPKNELERLVSELPRDADLAEELFLRALGRPPSAAELSAFGEMNDRIHASHAAITGQLEQAEADWKHRRKVLERDRLASLASIGKQIDQRKAAIKPDRDRLVAERDTAIQEAQAKVDQTRAAIPERIAQWTKRLASSAEWHPLMPSRLSASNNAALIPQPDRSIVASGNKDKGIYEITFRTKLRGITGFRLEAMTDPSLPNSGPGLPENGNFVVTELEIKAGPASDPKQSKAVKIVSGQADFEQQGYSAKAAFDGKTNDQGGWAVSPATGMLHWANFQLAVPIKFDGEVEVVIRLHQFHNAGEHRLGRFRISATTESEKIDLGQPEQYAAILSTPEKLRDQASKGLLEKHVALTDGAIKKAEAKLAEARKPLPPDATLVTLESRQTELSVPTPDDPALVQLRQDAKQSARQLQNIRLTAAEDLTWALINSPAFLFNH